MAKIYIVFYSMYGHIYTLAKEVAAGVKEAGHEVELYQVAETLSAEVLAKMGAPPKPDLPIITPQKLAEADGVIFGFPTRFGMMCAQMKAFFDSTGQQWQSGAYVGKPAAMFTSTGVQGGGQETTLMTAVTQLAHHGMIFVPTGFSYGAGMFNVDEVRGGSAYGPGCIAGPTGARQPSETELGHAKHQGKYFAGVVAKLAAK